MVNIRMAVKKDHKQWVATCYRPVTGESCGGKYTYSLGLSMWGK